ncbi:hypothetical protein AAKU67_001132 [Oxalobacteraceae bacterium GrIS 2.11]
MVCLVTQKYGNATNIQLEDFAQESTTSPKSSMPKGPQELCQVTKCKTNDKDQYLRSGMMFGIGFGILFIPGCALVGMGVMLFAAGRYLKGMYDGAKNLHGPEKDKYLDDSSKHFMTGIFFPITFPIMWLRGQKIFEGTTVENQVPKKCLAEIKPVQNNKHDLVEVDLEETTTKVGDQQE